MTFVGSWWNRLGSLLTAWCLFWGSHVTAAEVARLGTFEVDITPPLGSPVAYARTRSIDDPLSARGIVLQGSGRPIVLCAVDFLGIGNEGYRRWCTALAAAADTDPDRVSVHCLHQHDAPRCDDAVERLLAEHGLSGDRFDSGYLHDVLDRVSRAVKRATQESLAVDELGLGNARVERVASNRRILGPDGTVQVIRWSSTREPAAIAAPEGLIDPQLRMVSFWHQSRPIAVLTFYATHPQSYYGQGDVTCEFVGIARNLQQQAQRGLPHIHFNGAGGNITAGKYNDGSPENRPRLAQRLQQGMQQAWDSTQRRPISAEQIAWHSVSVRLPVADYLSVAESAAKLNDGQADSNAKLLAAEDLVWGTRCQAGDALQLSCLTLDNARLVLMPGELFVEYQLAAQALLPDQFVVMAAYADYGPGYIGTAASYREGGYEVRPSVSRVSPAVESVLQQGLRELLQVHQ